MTVYVDSLFLMNFFMDSVILFSVKMFVKSDVGILKVFMITILLALYGTLSVFGGLSFLYNVVFMAAIPMGTVLLLFGKKCFFKAAAVFWTSSLILGGGIYGIMQITSFKTAVYTGYVNVYFMDINPMIYIVGSAILYILMIILERTAIRSFSRNRIIIHGEVLFMDKSYGIKVLADTGCCLIEPLSGSPMILAEDRIFKEIPQPKSFIYTTTVAGRAKLPLIIPQAVNGENKLYRIKTDTPIALVRGKLCGDGLYNAIINPDALEDLTESYSEITELIPPPSSKDSGFRANFRRDYFFSTETAENDKTKATY